jgi:surfactin synthase thioesterase subunit
MVKGFGHTFLKTLANSQRHTKCKLSLQCDIVAHIGQHDHYQKKLWRRCAKKGIYLHIVGVNAK